MSKYLFYHLDEKGKNLTGGSRTVLNLIDGVRHVGIEPVFVSQHKGGLYEKLKEKGVEVCIIPLPDILDVYDKKILRYSAMKKVRSAYALLQYNQKIRRVAQEYQVQGIWARGLRSILHVGLASWLFRVPLVWDIGVELRPEGLLQFLFSAGLLLSDQVVTQATTQHELIFGRTLASWYAESLHTLYPGIASERVDRLRKNGDLSEEQSPQIINIGSIHPRKNQRMSLQAFECVREHHPDAVLNFAGRIEDKDYAESLRRYAYKHGLDSNVQFLGWRDDIPELLGRSSILILSSYREGIPHVVREAMYAAVPVVATSVGGVPEAVQDGETGFVVPPDEPQEMGDRIDYLLSHPEERERMGSAGFELAKERFSRKRWISEYANLLHNISCMFGNNINQQ